LLRDAVEITRTRWENDARARGLSYDVQLEADCALRTRGNASELREVFVNLIVNAIDAMPAGGKLSITCRRVEERLRLDFTDTGVGMDGEVRARIFEPFYTTKGVHGTGLGLFVSYGIIERHGGHITVDSEPDRGATFTLDLPHDEPVAPPRNDSASRVVEWNGPLSILVVDDESLVRETLGEMAASLGHRVTLADGGRAALALLEEGEFDLVFTDLSMPEMDGWELAREIRRRRPAQPICVVTGYGAEAGSANTADGAADAIIGKPFNFDQVEKVLARFKADRSEAD
jgi:CheY-like chemotaxis protein